LALINNQTHITFENYQNLKKKIFQEISYLPLDYVNIRLAKQEILNYPETKRRLKEMSESEINKLLKFLDKELTKSGSNVFSNNNFESVQNKFIRKLLFG